MNEALTIASVVSAVVNLGYSILVVDDASTDATASLASGSGATVISLIQNLGAWKASQTGIRYAQKLGFEVVVTMDGDAQHSAEHIPILVEQYLQGADVVIGNCTGRGSTARHLAWRFFKHLNRLNVDDITSGFRLYNKKAINCLVSKQATMLEYQDIGVLLMMRNLQLSIIETAVPMKERSEGVSRIFHSWFAVIYYLLYSGLLSVAKAFPTNKKKYKNRVIRLRNIE